MLFKMYHLETESESAKRDFGSSVWLYCERVDILGWVQLRQKVQQVGDFYLVYCTDWIVFLFISQKTGAVI